MAYTTINKPTEHFNTKLYTGDGTSNRSITGVGFQPDLLWVKSRNASYYHGLWDAVRTNKAAIYSNATVAEDTTTGGTLGSFDSDGFTTQNVSGGFVNNSGTTYASWSWKANGAGSANTDGSINSTVSVNTTSSFSIVSYTGTGANGTIGHGLGQAPDMIIVKRRDSTDGWKVYHSSRGATKYLQLNTTAAEGTLSSQWNDTEPTSSVFSVGTAGDINGSGGRTYIAYCFAEKQGYSKFSSFVGNGSNDGSFCFTGMKPSFVMIKRTDSTASWLMFDNKRANPFNEITADLRADLSNAEDASTSYNNIDFLSNGFKIRKSNADINASGGNYIYMAFAEAPLVGSNNVPCTAR